MINGKLVFYPAVIVTLVYLACYGWLQLAILHFYLPLYLVTSTVRNIKAKDTVSYERLAKLWVIYGGSIMLEWGFDLVFSLLPFNTIYHLLKLMLILWVLSSANNQEILYNMFVQIDNKSRDDLNAILVIAQEWYKDSRHYLDMYFSKIGDLFQLIKRD